MEGCVKPSEVLLPGENIGYEDHTEFIQTILKNRGISDCDEFLDPNLSYIYPLDDMLNIQKAGYYVIEGLKNKSKFFVHFDTDTDGVTAGTIMTRWLRGNGAEVDYYIGKGKAHGTCAELLERLKESEAEILIIVDSLDSNLTNYKYIKEELKKRIIVLDHHDVNPEIPYDDYTALVSSNREYKNPELSGAGVTWKFCMYCDSLLGTHDALNYADLAACGILADVMNIANMENRAIINYGFKHQNNLAIKKIIGTYPFNSTGVLFSIAPIINASCRLFKNEKVAEMFLSDDEYDINKIKRTLQQVKTMQNNEIDYLMDSIVLDIESQKDEPVILIKVTTENGITGLLANKILKETGKPTIVVTKKDNLYCGSGRAEDGINFRMLCEETGLCKAMGHPGAFGVEIDPGMLSMFYGALVSALQDYDFAPKRVNVDAVLDVADITPELIKKIKWVNRISGNGFDPLKFLVYSDNFSANSMTQNKHLCCDDDCGFKFIKWNAGSNVNEFKDYEILGDRVGFIGTLDSGYFGKTFNMRMIIENYFVD